MMKTRMFAGLAAVAVLVLALAAVAYASTVEAKLTSFKYDSATKVGHLTIKAKHKLKIKVTSKTNCGVSRGQSGDQIACKTLGKPKYAGKPVTVQYKKNSSGVRVASLVAVHL
jgi:hypothetical protein